MQSQNTISRTTVECLQQLAKQLELTVRAKRATYILYKTKKQPIKWVALAHLGERQTEVHFCPKHSVRYLEVLCSIHRSDISFALIERIKCSFWQRHGTGVAGERAETKNANFWSWRRTPSLYSTIRQSHETMCIFVCFIIAGLVCAMCLGPE